FGGKERDLDSVDVLDEIVLDDGPPALVMGLVRVNFVDEGRDLYALSLLVDRDGGIRDALQDADRLRILGRLMSQGETLETYSGSFHFGGPGLDPLSPPGESARAVSAEQSNSSIILDEDVIVKLFRRVQVGVNPDLELNRLLTNEGFENVPPHVGEVIYEGSIDDESVSVDLGIAQQFVDDAREGWTTTLQQLHDLYDSADDGSDIEPAVSERASGLLEELEDLGDVTASLHVLLSREEFEPDVAPDPIGSHDLKEWAERARWSLDRLVRAGVTELEPHREGIERKIDGLTSIDDAGMKTRVHGDFHLGQVMRNPRGWLIIDFEGEPLRSMEERRAKQSPLRDVAGMLRSFSYAATAALFDRAEPGSDEWQRLQPWADAWEARAREVFITAYHRTAVEGSFLPTDRETFNQLLDAFEIDKALYELGYERGHRPRWARIPLRGIVEVLEQGAAR
ncbi:MAG: hypothetical protein ACRDJ5_01845, partial [Actinomycetota bacterium]